MSGLGYERDTLLRVLAPLIDETSASGAAILVAARVNGGPNIMLRVPWIRSLRFDRAVDAIESIDAEIREIAREHR